MATIEALLCSAINDFVETLAVEKDHHHGTNGLLSQLSPPGLTDPLPCAAVYARFNRNSRRGGAAPRGEAPGPASGGDGGDIYLTVGSAAPAPGPVYKTVPPAAQRGKTPPRPVKGEAEEFEKFEEIEELEGQGPAAAGGSDEPGYATIPALEARKAPPLRRNDSGRGGGKALPD